EQRRWIVILESVVADHVEIGKLTEHGLKQIRSLRQSCADKQTTIAAALNRQPRWIRVLVFDKPLGSAYEIVKDVLFFIEHAGFVPGLAKLSTAANVRECINSALLHPNRGRCTEPRCLTNIEASIPIQQHREFPIRLQTFL